MSEGFWTEERVQWLIEAWTGRASATALAREAGVTRNVIIGKVHRLQAAGLLAPRSGATQRRTPRALPPRPGQPAPTITRSTVVEPEPLSLDDGRPITLINLERARMCCWPLGDPALPDFRYCGHGKFPGSPYCEAHTVIGRQGKRAGD